MTSRILLADDHPVALVGLADVVARCDAGSISGVARSADELLQHLHGTLCDAVVTDFCIPAHSGASGLTLLHEIRTRFPDVSIVVVTTASNPAIYHTILSMGVKALISKSEPVEEISQAINAALEGRTYVGSSVLRLITQGGLPMSFNQSRLSRLSRSEYLIVRAWANGVSLKAMAVALDVTLNAVYWRKRAAMRKLGTRTDIELFAYMAELAGLPKEWFATEGCDYQLTSMDSLFSVPH
jgi:two-component system capsular synthesis response regulator RcsB